MTSYLFYFRQLLTIMIIFVLWSTSLFAQITIKEKVTINPTHRNTSSLGEQSGIGAPSGFIMPKNGMLQVVYETDDRFSSGAGAKYFTLDDRLMIDVRHGSTIILDTLASRLANIYVSSVSCGSYNTKTHYSNDEIIPVTFVSVQQGDTVQFYYRTKNIPSGGDTLLAISDVLQTWMFGTQIVGWQFDFSSVYNGCTPYEDLTISAYVTDTTISIVPPPSNSVYPRYLGHNNSTDKNDTLSLQVQTSFGGSPAKNIWVRVDSSALVDSGGHTHGGSRPLGTFLIPKLSTASYDSSVKSFTKQTDSLGILNFKYVASQFGGIERIRVVRLSDTTAYDTLRISTRVQNLQSISTTHTNLITATSTEVFHRLANSDYGLSATITSIYSAVDQYATAAGMPANIYLAAIDMSLPYGGGFDIAGGWNANLLSGASGHILHRDGKSVDFSKFYKDASGTTITVDIYSDGVFVKSTNRIDQGLLDGFFDDLGYDRKEKRIDKIHYESRQ